MFDFVYNECLYDGNGRKTPKYKNKCEKQGKIPCLVTLPSPRLRDVKNGNKIQFCLLLSKNSFSLEWVK